MVEIRTLQCHTSHTRKLKTLKNRKLKKKLKEVTGNDKLAFDDVDFEEDFDPKEHDRKMQEIFDDEYYQVEETGEKPECPDIEELAVENWDDYDPTKDEDFNYDYATL
jgi:protein KRI1